jgi:hypothetical protein
MRAFVVAMWLFVACLSPASAAEVITTGKDLLDACSLLVEDVGGRRDQGQALKMGFCLGFVRAMLTAGPMLGVEGKFCPPKQTTNGEAVNILVKYLRDNPERMPRNAEPLAIHAFYLVWGCK